MKDLVGVMRNHEVPDRTVRCESLLTTTPAASANSNNAPVRMPESSREKELMLRIRERPLDSTATAAMPSSVPWTEPIPPKMLVPPSTTAVIAASSYPVPALAGRK